MISLHLQINMLLLIVCFFTCVPSATANESNPSSIFKKAKTSKQRLNAFVTAVDRRLIYKGMNVLDLDKILVSEIAKKNHSNEPGVTTSVYNFGKFDEEWYLAVDYNNEGKVLGFYLSNAAKGGGSPEPAKVSIEYLAFKFRKANTPSKKLACAIQAIESRVIRQGTKRTTLSAIFGNSTEEKEVQLYDHKNIVSLFVFGTDKDSWRLTTIRNSNSDYIFYYGLTDFDNKPEKYYQ